MSGRLAVVLVILTLTVGVVGYRISRESGTRRVDVMAREAQRLFDASRAEWAKGNPLDPGAVEGRIQDWVGAKVVLPRDEQLFSYRGATRERFGKLTVAAVRLTFGEDPFLLLVARPEPFRGGEDPSPLVSESSFLSWEKEGKSFVSWERDGVLYILVSNVDLTRTFDLVRQYFT